MIGAVVLELHAASSGNENVANAPVRTRRRVGWGELGRGRVTVTFCGSKPSHVQRVLGQTPRAYNTTGIAGGRSWCARPSAIVHEMLYYL